MRTSAPLLAPARKRTLAEDVTERLREAILHGYFAPGQPLSEEQLARSLAVSRGPIRDALQQLEREGLILTGANGRATIARLSQRDLDQVYSLRLALERLAVVEAMHNAGRADFEAMEAIVQSMEQSVARGMTAQEAADLDIAFHDLIYRAARHERLYDAWSNLKSQVYVFLLSRNLADSDYKGQLTIQGHAQLLDALRARDEAYAVETIETHLRAAYSRIVKNYPSLDTSADGHSMQRLEEPALSSRSAAPSPTPTPRRTRQTNKK